MEQESKRAYKGTVHALEPGVKIGSEFTLCPNGTADFLKFRKEYFDQLYAKQQDQLDKLAHDDIIITLPDGKEFPGKAYITTPMDIAKGISNKLAKEAVAAKVCLSNPAKAADVVDADDENIDAKHAPATNIEERLWDMTRPFPCSCTMKILKFGDTDAESVFWHSSAHLLGEALELLYGCHLTIGPALTKGFYYDFYAGDSVKINQDSYAELQKKYEECASSNQPFQRLVMTKDEALVMFQHNPFKVALIAAKVPENGLTSCYRCGTLVDLCMGPHLPASSLVKAFAVEKHSAAYWLGNSGGDSLQRVYGITFPDAKLLKEHIRIVEEAKKRDHRILGTNLELFFFDANYSPGAAFWLPEGAKLYNKLCDLMRQQYREWGFTEVITPNMYNCDMFRTSGHYQNYKDCMFLMNVENKEWSMKPMNCPPHAIMFRKMNPSYKQLPLRLADFGVLHRNELSGSLTGLTRVRRFCQDDAHIFCRFNQISDEVDMSLRFLMFTYGLFGFNFRFMLSTRPEHYLGEISVWDAAEKQLEEALNKSKTEWKLNPGDGAFYGPKIDVELQDALKRWHQCGTIQLDFQQPLRFDLKYRTEECSEEEPPTNSEPASRTDPAEMSATPAVSAGPRADGSLETELKPGYARPVMVHRAILGSIERMTAVLLEHTGGRLPFWCSPRQAIICPISEKYLAYAKYLGDILNKRGYDISVDESANTISKKIRDAQIQQWNYILVVGQQEQESQTITLRKREDPTNQSKVDIHELLDRFEEELDVTNSKSKNTIKPFMPKCDSSEASTAAAPSSPVA